MKKVLAVIAVSYAVLVSFSAVYANVNSSDYGSVDTFNADTAVVGSQALDSAQNVVKSEVFDLSESVGITEGTSSGLDQSGYTQSYTNTGVNYYTNSQGHTVQSPTYYDSAPATATAKCKDGTYSFSESRRGTCSHHGGVSVWY